MNTLQRYVIRKMLAAFLVALLALGITIWLSQALRQFNLVTSGGQAFFTFLHLTVLALPFLLAVIVPVSVMIAVIYTLVTLNNASELAIIGASGGAPGMVMKPVLTVAIVIAALMLFVSLFLSPDTQRRMRDLLTVINTDILTSVIRDGQFINVGDGLTIHVKRRNPDRSLENIFVSDNREPDQVVTYMARAGAIVASTAGSFLIMQNGVIQRQNKTENSISMIEFVSYAFDLSSFTAGGTVTNYPPSARATSYLLKPDPDDPIFQKFPDRFRAEFADRVISPLYVIAFALIPLAFLGEPRTSRQRRGWTIAIIIVLMVVLRQGGVVLTSTAGNNPSLIPLIYALPPLTIALALAIISGLLRPHLPLPMVRAFEAFGRSISSQFSRGRAVPAEGPRQR